MRRVFHALTLSSFLHNTQFAMSDPRCKTFVELFALRVKIWALWTSNIVCALELAFSLFPRAVQVTVYIIGWLMTISSRSQQQRLLRA